MPRPGSYLYRQKGSLNWYLRLQYPPYLAQREGRKKIERSLGTSDRLEAEIRAAEAILEHKRKLFFGETGGTGPLRRSKAQGSLNRAEATTFRTVVQ